MDAKDLRIVFMGTPEFAVPSLLALVGGGYNVVGVVLRPTNPPDADRKYTGARLRSRLWNWVCRYCSPKS